MTNSKALNPFQLFRRWNSTRGIYDLQPCGKDWILRVVARICRLDADGKIMWQSEIPTETVAMHLPLVVSNGIAVTASKSEDMSYSLLAYEVEGGKLIWSEPCDWTGSNTYGGMFLWEGRLFVPGGGKMMVPPAKILDFQTGKVIGEVKEWITPPTPQGIGSFNRNCIQVEQWLFSNMKGEGAFRIDLSIGEPTFESIPDIRFARLAAMENVVMMLCQHLEELVILAMDSGSLHILHRHSLDIIEQAVGDAIEIRGINTKTALIIGESGLASFNLVSGQINWTYAPSMPLERWSGGLLIDGSFIVEEIRDEHPALTEIDAPNGNVLQSVPSSDFFLGKGIFAMGDRILADATGSFLQFERREAAPQLGEDSDFFETRSSTEPPQAPPTFTPTDQQYSAIITAFVNAKAAQEQGRDADHQRLAAEFNQLFDAFAQVHPEVSIANIALTLSELGVPYEVALGDVVRMRG